MIFLNPLIPTREFPELHYMTEKQKQKQNK